MSDEEILIQRRALEREARYSERLTSFLVCMMEGHQATDRPRHWTRGGSLRPCGRCGLGFFEEEVQKPPFVYEGSPR